MIKIVISLCLTGGLWLIGQVLWRRRMAAGQALARSIGAGEACMACEAEAVTREPDGVRCDVCGHFAPAALLGGDGPVDPALLSTLTVDPADKRPWYAR